MIRRAIAIVVLILGCSAWDDAHAANCSPVPFTFVNGQSADANQVNSNFGSLVTCANSNLLGAANNLSDVGSASASRTNLGLGASSVENLGNNVVDDGVGNLYSKASLHSTIVRSSGSFTIPTNITTSAVFKITVVGGGGGGGGASGTNVSGGGGGSGGYAVGWFSGLTAGQVLTIIVGTGGAGGSSSGGNGATGGATQVFSPSSVLMIECNPGLGGVGQTTSGGSSGGSYGTCLPSTTATTLGGGQAGSPGFGVYGLEAPGGSNPLGTGGFFAAGIVGGGGAGGVTASGSAAGFSGGAGEVIIEWVQ
jgi:hypothetical protein